jgi:hypothetical protein
MSNKYSNYEYYLSSYSKLNKRAKFFLYAKKHNEINPFNFLLERKSGIRYMLNQDYENLEISFDSVETGLKDDHEKHFHISQLYATQKDLAEEIVWKAKIYNKSYQANLRKSFSKLFPRNMDFNRFILGNYYEVKDIHKRPMSKLVQDIARQLRLI